MSLRHRNADEADALLESTQPEYSTTALKTTIGPSAIDGANVHRDDGDGRHGETFDNIPESKRQLGIWSVVLLIFNRIIGTGIYATPSIILRASGSVGVAFIMWLLGSSIAALGTAVYVELGTGLPRNGGEKNYLEFMYRRPKFMISCIFCVYGLIMGSNAANSIVFGEYVVNMLGLPPSPTTSRLLAIGCLVLCLILHGVIMNVGVKVQNSLGIFKLAVLLAIALSGLLSLAGAPGFAVKPGYDVAHNFEWDTFWEGSGQGSNAFVAGLYNVIWSFIGYSNANYALSEVRDPVKTIKRAAPIALISVIVSYMLINVAYFAVVSKKDILESRRIVAALFFRNLFGPVTERALSAFISLSILGNVLSVTFSQGRVIQEFAREGILPFSAFFASNKPFNAPLTAILVQTIISIILVIGPPPGDAYLFMISLPSYAMSAVNLFVALGLLLLYTPAYRVWDWSPPFRAPKIVIVLFLLTHIFLITVPLIPPGEDNRTYEHIPYWSHVVVSYALSLVGITYWYVSFVWIPRKGGYRLEREWILQDDGVSRAIFRKVPI